MTRSRDLVAFALLRARREDKETEEREGSGGGRGAARGERGPRERKSRGEDGGDALVLQTGGCCIDRPNFDGKIEVEIDGRKRERERGIPDSLLSIRIPLAHWKKSV